MSRARTRPRDAPTFVATVALRVTLSQARTVGSRFECGRLLYNACLRAALDRAAAMRADPGWAQAMARPRTVAGKPNQNGPMCSKTYGSGTALPAGRWRLSPRAFVPAG